MTLENRILLNLFNRTYKIETDVTPEIANRVIGFLEEKVNQIKVDTDSATSKELIIIMAALNITKELFEIKDSQEAFLNNIAKRSYNLLKILDLQC